MPLRYALLLPFLLRQPHRHDSVPFSLQVQQTQQPWPPRSNYFYPRSPCGERPVRQCRYRYTNFDFYPRSPCGERRSSVHSLQSSSCISIHALLAESDDVACGDRHKLRNFYPRSPCGERPFRSPRIALMVDFYPRSPCGERLIFTARQAAIGVFLSTLSLRRATRRVLKCDNRAIISIHALLAESDVQSTLSRSITRNFYPRSPCGERPMPSYRLAIWKDFYPRSPCGERHDYG